MGETILDKPRKIDECIYVLRIIQIRIPDNVGKEIQ